MIRFVASQTTRRIALFLCGLAVLCSGRTLYPQDAPTAVQSVSPSGLGLGAIQVVSQIPPRPGCWWAMPITVSNQSDKTRRAALVATLHGQPRAEYRHELTLLPGETRQEEIMVRFPRTAGLGSIITIDVSLRERHGGRESIVRAKGLPMVQRIPVKLSTDPVSTALLPSDPPTYPAEWDWRTYSVDESYELAVAARRAVGLNRAMTIFQRGSLPSDPRRWEAIDNAIVNNDRWLDDLTAVVAFRRWLTEGGKAWVSLDRVAPSRLETLLGDLWICSVVDQVELSDFEISSAQVPELASSPRQVRRQRPVKFLRVVQDGGKVTHWVNGWPAAVRIPVGEGAVWVTMLGATGWFNEIDESSGQVALQSYRVEPWLIPIAGALFYPREPLDPNFLNAAVAASFVGYPVPSRNLVIAMLSFAFVATATCGVMMFRRDRLEQLGWMAPLILVLSASPLFWLAERRRQHTPNSLGRIQLARPQAGSGHTIVKELNTLYFTEEGPIRMRVPLGAIIEPFPGVISPPVHRIADRDDQFVALRVANWPVGIRGLVSEFQCTTGAMEAIGTFTSDGVVFEFPTALPSVPSDPVYAVSASRRAAMQQLSRNKFLLPGEPLEDPGSLDFGNEILIEPDTVRHERAYEELLSEDAARKLLPRPALFCWTRAWESPLRTDRNLPTKGEALNQMSIRFLTAEPGTSVNVPSVMVPPEVPSQFQSDGLIRQFADDQPHIPASREKTWHVEWHLPNELLPLDLDEVEFTVETDAPGWIVSVGSVGRNGEPGKIWERYKSPRGRIRVLPTFDQVTFDRWEGIIRTQFVVRPIDASRHADEMNATPDQPSGQSDTAEDERDLSPDSVRPRSWQLLRPRLRVSGTIGTRLPAS